jgi:hypothetical protein
VSIVYRLKKAGLILIILGACFILAWGISIMMTLGALKTNLEDVQTLMEVDNPLSIDPECISILMNSTRENVIKLRRKTALVAKYSPVFAWAPNVGPFLQSLPDLLDLADLGTQTAYDLWTIAKPTFVMAKAHGVSFVEIETLIDAILDADYPMLVRDAYRLLQLYDSVDASAIPWRYRALFIQLGDGLSLYAYGLQLVDDVPSIIGLDEPVTYLVLALNEDELRGGGGFITGVGEFVIRNGEIASMQFTDSYFADDFSLPYPDAPAPFSQFMNIDLWVFRDSNWSPDFPTSARQAIALYRPPESVTPAGVVAINQYAAASIIDVVGPLRIPGDPTMVTSETLVEYMRNAWSPENFDNTYEWGQQRKSFLGDLTKAALQKIESGSVDWTNLLRVTVQLIEQRHIQIYMENEDTEVFLEAENWASTLYLPSYDFFTFVESNVGYNKASTRIERILTYAVDLTQTPITAELTLSLRHRSQLKVSCTPGANVFPTYEQSMDRCYWASYRFYVPEGTQLLTASEHPIPANQVLTGQSWPGVTTVESAPEGGATVFEQAILLPTASTVAIYFKYSLPENTVQEQEDGTLIYSLGLQKQAGLRTIPTTIKLHVPHNAIISSMHPEAQQVEPGVLIYELSLIQNMRIELQYSIPGKEEP